jgi:Na+/melibiose symporter-like transporter
MITEISGITLGVIALVIVGLFFVVRGFSMPSIFFKNQKKREEIKKKLREREQAEEAARSEEKPEQE